MISPTESSREEARDLMEMQYLAALSQFIYNINQMSWTSFDQILRRASHELYEKSLTHFNMT